MDNNEARIYLNGEGIHVVDVKHNEYETVLVWRTIEEETITETISHPKNMSLQAVVELYVKQSIPLKSNGVWVVNQLGDLELESYTK